MSLYLLVCRGHYSAFLEAARVLVQYIRGRERAWRVHKSDLRGIRMRVESIMIVEAMTVLIKAVRVM